MTFKAGHSIPVYKSVPKNDCCDQTCLVGHTFHLLLDVTSYIYENLPLTQVSIWASADIYDDLGSQEGAQRSWHPSAFGPLAACCYVKAVISPRCPASFLPDSNATEIDSPAVQLILLA